MEYHLDLTAIVANNWNYGMTGGQFSPLTPAAGLSSTSRSGKAEPDMDICRLAEVSGANYAARTTVYHVVEMRRLFREAALKKGFSLVEVLTPCPTYFGRYNRQGGAAEMIDQFREKVIPLKKYLEMDEAKREKFTWRGVLTDRNRPDYSSRYREIYGFSGAVSLPDDSRREPQPGGGRKVEKPVKITLAGTGGQGLGLGGKILAEAALRGGNSAAQSQSFGTRARGGSSSSAVIIGQGEIVYPLVEHPDIVVALTQEAYDENRPILAPGGLVIYDIDTVSARGGREETGYPITGRAREINNEKGVTLLALGVLTGLTGLLDPAAVEAAIGENFSGAAAAANRQAFLEGLALAGGTPARGI